MTGHYCCKDVIYLQTTKACYSSFWYENLVACQKILHVHVHIYRDYILSRQYKV